MRTLLFTGWLLICMASLHAQDVVEDSVIPDRDPVESVPVSQQWKRNELELPSDSIRAVKQTPDLVYLQQFDSVLKAVKAQQAALSKPPEPQGPSWLERVMEARFTVYLLWALALFFVGYMLFRLFISGIFRRTPGKGILSPETVPAAAVTAQDWHSLAHTYAKGGDYRMATRCVYLHTLHVLNEKGSIRFTADKTNGRYLAELQGTPVQRFAAELFRYYEYSWYGGFTTDALIFQKVTSLMQQILEAK